jgi:ATP-dependent DNA helicase RecG
MARPPARPKPKRTPTGVRDSASKVAALGRILRHEADTGHQDRAVIGGLDRFLQAAADELRSKLGDIRPYGVLAADERRRWTSDLIGRIDRSGLAANSGSERGPGRTRKPGAPGKRPPGPRPTGPKRGGIADLKIAGGIARHLPRLEKLGIGSVQGAIRHYPHRHNDFAHVTKISQLEHGKEQTIVATVWEASEQRRGPRSVSVHAVLGDETGNVRAIWFGQGYLVKTLKPGAEVVISGSVKTFKGRHVFESPEYELLTGQEELVHTGRLVPVYPTTEGLPQRTMRRIIRASLKAGLTDVRETLPEQVRQRMGLMELPAAVAQIHYPDSAADLDAARRRLAFDEMLLLQLAVLRRRQEWHDEADGIPLGPVGNGDAKRGSLVDAFLGSLPFDLTDAQRRVLGEVAADLSQPRPMVRLLQGDVGMAPTEILAEQHVLTVGRLLAGGPPQIDERGAMAAIKMPNGRSVTVALLTGGTRKRARDVLAGAIAAGEVDIVVGTHALIQESVDIPNLAVGIVDEQHRFGVMQRAALTDGGLRPHLLAMSATPIPRSLSLTVFGDLDVSVLDEMPPGRKPVKTRWVVPEQRESAYDFVRTELEAGRQAFIVFPLVEGSDAVQARAATEEHERLSRDVFAEHRLGLLHGRMKSAEKEDVMVRFSAGELDALVSTSVIEVGIDVPNATVMVIDGADRFGLAQLHQFRGRVGRGAAQSYCLLLSDAAGPDAAERLRIIETVSDGFKLAEEDLRLRGPGDFLGTRQSGLPELRVASITDTGTASRARREASAMLEADPQLKAPEHGALALALSKLLAASAPGGG